MGAKEEEKKDGASGTDVEGRPKERVEGMRRD